jgi:SOS-response transcriptional repressor LexA
MKEHDVLKKLSDNLNILMAKARLSANELAKHTGLPATTIKRIRTDDDANPTLTSLMPIAEYFAISLSELIGESSMNEARSSLVATGLQEVPLLNWSESIHYEVIDYDKYPKKVLTEKKIGNKGFALLVENSEIDIFPKGAIILVDPEIKISTGDYVVVSKGDSSVLSIKKIIIDVDQPYLKALIPGAGIIPFTDEYKILGVIIQYKVDFKKQLL